MKVKIHNIINAEADHIIVWKDENGWHTEDWGNQNLLPLYGDLPEALVVGQEAKDGDPTREYFLVEVKVVLKFRSKNETI